MPTIYLKEKSYPLKVHYNIQRRFILNDLFKIAQQFQSLFKICVGLSSCLPPPCWLAWCAGDAPASYSSAWKLSWAPVHEPLHGLQMLLYHFFALPASIFHWVIIPLDQILIVFFPPGFLSHSLVQYALHLRLLCYRLLLHPLDHWLLSSSLCFSSPVWV